MIDGWHTADKKPTQEMINNTKSGLFWTICNGWQGQKTFSDVCGWNHSGVTHWRELPPYPKGYQRFSDDYIGIDED